jgi:hypothetical protein
MILLLTSATFFRSMHACMHACKMHARCICKVCHSQELLWAHEDDDSESVILLGNGDHESDEPGESRSPDANHDGEPGE